MVCVLCGPLLVYSGFLWSTVQSFDCCGGCGGVRLSSHRGSVLTVAIMCKCSILWYTVRVQCAFNKLMPCVWSVKWDKIKCVHSV